jgi:hypothetical protein
MRASVSLAVACGLVLLGSGCTADTEAATEGSGATTQAPATTPLSGPDAPPVGWPDEAPAEVGAEQWAVFLAVGAAGGPGLAEATDFLAMPKPAGGDPEQFRGFVDMLRITRNCP